MKNKKSYQNKTIHVARYLWRMKMKNTEEISSNYLKK